MSEQLALLPSPLETTLHWAELLNAVVGSALEVHLTVPVGTVGTAGEATVSVTVTVQVHGTFACEVVDVQLSVVVVGSCTTIPNWPPWLVTCAASPP